MCLITHISYEHSACNLAFQYPSLFLPISNSRRNGVRTALPSFSLGKPSLSNSVHKPYKYSRVGLGNPFGCHHCLSKCAMLSKRGRAKPHNSIVQRPKLLERACKGSLLSSAKLEVVMHGVRQYNTRDPILTPTPSRSESFPLVNVSPPFF